MGMGLRTNLYSIGGDSLTQLKKLIFVSFERNADSDKINGKDVGDLLTQLKLIK